MFQTMIWYISTAHFTSQRQNRFESHLDKAERLSIDTKGPIIVWVSQLDKKDLDKILTAQKNNTEGLFPYQEGKVLLLDEGVQQLGLGHYIFNQEPNPFFYKWTEILGKTKLTICRDELRHPCTKRTKLFRHRNTTGELPYIPLAARVDNYSRIRTQQCIQPLEIFLVTPTLRERPGTNTVYMGIETHLCPPGNLVNHIRAKPKSGSIKMFVQNI